MIPKFRGKYANEKKLVSLAQRIKPPAPEQRVGGIPRRTKTVDLGTRILSKVGAVRGFTASNEEAKEASNLASSARKGHTVRLQGQEQASAEESTQTTTALNAVSEQTPLLDSSSTTTGGYHSVRVFDQDAATANQTSTNRNYPGSTGQRSIMQRRSLPAALESGESERLLNEAVQSEYCGEFVAEYLSTIEMVETFYNEEIKVYGKRMETALNHLRNAHGTETAKVGVREELVEIYRNLHLMESYALVNFSLLINVLSCEQVKRCVVFRNQSINHTRDVAPLFIRGLLKDHVSGRDFVTRTELHSKIAKLERVYAMLFHDGHREIAKYMLLKKRTKPVPMEHISVGFSVGMSLILLLWVINSIEAMDHDGNAHKVAFAAWGSGGTRVFRVFAELIALIWTLAFLLWTLKQWRVNFMLLFGIPTHSPPRVVSVMRVASHLSVVFLTCELISVKIARGNFASISPSWAGAVPFGMLVTTTVFLMVVIVQFIVTHRRSLALDYRKYLWQVLLFVTGLSESTFLVAFVTDYLTSSARLLADLSFVACYLFAEQHPVEALQPGVQTWCDSSPVLNVWIVPIVSVWPLALRLIQNLKQFYNEPNGSPRRTTFILNAGKYALNHTVVIFSVLHYNLMHGDHTSTWEILFFCSFAIASFVAWLWDVVMDWGLGDPQHNMLRETRMCTDKRVYYLAIILDFFFRFVWATTLVPARSLPVQVMNFPLILTTVELIRRSFWAALRCEHEHLNNTRGYRSDNVFVPLYFDSPMHDTSEDSADVSEKSSSKKWITMLEVSVVIILVAGLGVTAAVL